MAVKRTDFDLVPDELADAVLLYARWLDDLGFRLKCEPFDLEYPSTPVFLATRGGENHYIEVATGLNISRAQEWVKYGRASTKDTRFVMAIANGRSVTPSSLMQLKALGVGLHIIDGQVIEEICGPHDLSLTVEFPAIPKKLRTLLGPSRDLLAEGNWKEAYEDACLALETVARSHLLKQVKNGQVLFVSDKGKAMVYSEVRVEKMTMGALSIAYSELAAPTLVEARTAQALARINPRRITVAHFKYKSGKRARELRSQVGKDLNVIVNTIALLRQ